MVASKECKTRTIGREKLLKKQGGCPLNRRYGCHLIYNLIAVCDHRQDASCVTLRRCINQGKRHCCLKQHQERPASIPGHWTGPWSLKQARWCSSVLGGFNSSLHWPASYWDCWGSRTLRSTWPLCPAPSFSYVHWLMSLGSVMWLEHFLCFQSSNYLVPVKVTIPWFMILCNLTSGFLRLHSLVCDTVRSHVMSTLLREK